MSSNFDNSHLFAFGVGLLTCFIASRLLTPKNPDIIPSVKDSDCDSDSDDDLLERDGQASLMPQNLKMVLVVRNDLKMGKGKIGAQCGHAVLGAFKRARKYTPDAVASWERWGQAKICVKVNSEAELLEIQMAARALSLVNYVVQDAGRTQIESGSLTVLAIGPVAADTVDQLTGHLKLL